MIYFTIALCHSQRSEAQNPEFHGSGILAVSNACESICGRTGPSQLLSRTDEFDQERA